jgi:ribonuclease P protein component
LKRRRDFLRVAEGVRAAKPGLVLQARPMPDGDPSVPVRVGSPDGDSGVPVRIGFTATRKIGNAVMRNRARRRLRAAAAAVLPGAARPGHDYVLVARAGTLTRDYAALVDDLSRAVDDVHRARGGGRKPASRRQAPRS